MKWRTTFFGKAIDIESVQTYLQFDATPNVKMLQNSYNIITSYGRLCAYCLSLQS